MNKNIIRKEFENCLSFDVFKKRIWDDRGLNRLIEDANSYYKNFKLKFLVCKNFSYPYKTFHFTENSLTYTNEYFIYLDFKNKKIALTPSPEYQFSSLLVELNHNIQNSYIVNIDKHKEDYISKAFFIFENEQPEFYFPVVDYYQYHNGLSEVKVKFLRDGRGNKYFNLEEYKEELIKYLFKKFCKNAERILQDPLSSLDDDFGYLPYSDIFDDSVKRCRGDFLSKKLISTDEFQDFTGFNFLFKKLILNNDHRDIYINISEKTKVDFIEKLEEFIANNSINGTINRKYYDKEDLLIKMVENCFYSIGGLKETLEKTPKNEFLNIKHIIDNVK